MCSSISLLIGCQSLKTPKLPTLPTTTLPSDQAATADSTLHFSIRGKIGVRTPKQNGSAFYAWIQDGNRFAIDLTGALGIGQTHIEGIPGQVSLQSAKTGLLQATTPEELLTQATGWLAPISYLPHWILGQQNQATSPATRDAQGRLLTLNEGGWQVTFDYDSSNSSLQPSKLTMLQSLDDHTSNRIILTIQTADQPADASPTPQATPATGSAS